jgi:carbonic anhydrase
MVNVAVQVQTLAEHPLVREHFQRGRLDVIGLFYDIPSATALRITPTVVRPLQMSNGATEIDAAV